MIKSLDFLTSTVKYQENVEFLVPLNKLYELVASCQHVEGSDYCGALVRIVDKKVLEINKGNRYLLQVWQKGGKLIFEKSLLTPCVNWNITSDTFIFQEDQEVPEIYLVTLKDEEEAKANNNDKDELKVNDRRGDKVEIEEKIETNIRPRIIKFKLPQSVIENHKGTRFDPDVGKLVIPSEDSECERDSDDGGFASDHEDSIDDPDGDFADLNNGNLDDTAAKLAPALNVIAKPATKISHADKKLSISM